MKEEKKRKTARNTLH